jgi:hypothetical protein
MIIGNRLPARKRISNAFLAQKGGGADGLTTVDPPEQEKDYPEPSRFAALPAQALFVRHAKAVDVNDVAVASDAADARPACWLDDVGRGQVLPP